ncbi:MAG: ATP-dependent DNA helicase RecQ, partial [Flavobacteriales bacterium]|nr:ATP-dependent DNA helicase RecQ [Flavobacteriales bacterium]
IQNIDRKLPLEDIAFSKQLSVDKLIDEIEAIVSSGTKVDINYYIDNEIDNDKVDEIYEYFNEAETDSVQDAIEELGEDDFTEEEIRLVRIKFMSELGN